MKYFCSLLVLFSFLTGVHAKSNSPTEIIFWHHYADDMRADFWEHHAELFNNTQSGIHVRVELFPTYYNQHDAILGALVNGGQPDVAFVLPSHAALYQLGNNIIDLTPHIEQSSLAPTDFHPEIWEQDTHNNQQLGIPLHRSSPVLYTNLNQLQALGYNSPPQNREEWVEMACAFDGTALDITLDAGWILATSQPMLFFNPSEFDFEQDALRNTIDFIRELLAQGCADLPLGDRNSIQTRFASGQTLFYLDSSSARPFVEFAIQQFFANPFPITISGIPSNDGVILNLTAPSLVIFRSTPDQHTAAWQWIEWLAELEQSQPWAQLNNGLPARIDITPPDFPAGQWMTEPTVTGYDLIRDELIFAIRGILAGNDQQTTLAELTTTANRIYTAFVLE